MDDNHQWNEQPKEPEREPPAPWEEEDYGAADPPSPGRARHDAFIPARRATFLKHLVKTGCIADAARLTGVSPRTIYNHQEKDAECARHCELAIRMAGGGIEQVAYERAVTGVPEQFACGGKVYTRTRYSESLLRLLLQASNPKKYGPRPGFTRKRLRAWERKEIEKQVRDDIRRKQPTFEQAIELLDHKLQMFGINIDRQEAEEAERRHAAGWTLTDEGDRIPPGWVRDPRLPGPAQESGGEQTPRDSL